MIRKATHTDYSRIAEGRLAVHENRLSESRSKMVVEASQFVNSRTNGKLGLSRLRLSPELKVLPVLPMVDLRCFSITVRLRRA